MPDYSKWAKLEDSEEENEVRQREEASLKQAKFDTHRDLQGEIDGWLRRALHRLPKDDTPEQLKATMPEFSQAHTHAVRPFRKITEKERQALSFFIAVNWFEEGETNLDRHAQILDVIRHDRWLEEDPGTVELLCRLHNHAMKDSETKNPAHSQSHLDGDTHKMRLMVLTAINTLAAPKRAKCSKGLLEMFNLVCTPEDEAGREMRLKWQKKEFGKDALFESLFPDLKAYQDGEMDDDKGEFWIVLGLCVLALVGIVAFAYMYMYGPDILGIPDHRGKNKAGNKRGGNATQTTPTTAIGELSMAEQAAAALGVPPRPAESAEPIESEWGDDSVCADTNDSCQRWAAKGECTKNAAFMLANCKFSCKACEASAPPAPPPDDGHGAEL